MTFYLINQCNIFDVFAEHGGAAFEEFLNCIGERVRLKGFDKFRAQLDNKSKLSSVVFTWKLFTKLVNKKPGLYDLTYTK